MYKIKMTGPRSIQSKLHRLSKELNEDAARIARECPQYNILIGDLLKLSQNLELVAKSITDDIM